MTARETREANAEQLTGPEKFAQRPLTPIFHKSPRPAMIITEGEWTSRAGESAILQARQGVNASGGNFHFA